MSGHKAIPVHIVVPNHLPKLLDLIRHKYPPFLQVGKELRKSKYHGNCQGHKFSGYPPFPQTRLSVSFGVHGEIAFVRGG